MNIHFNKLQDEYINTLAKTSFIEFKEKISKLSIYKRSIFTSWRRDWKKRVLDINTEFGRDYYQQMINESKPERWISSFRVFNSCSRVFISEIMKREVQQLLKKKTAIALATVSNDEIQELVSKRPDVFKYFSCELSPQEAIIKSQELRVYEFSRIVFNRDDVNQLLKSISKKKAFKLIKKSYLGLKIVLMRKDVSFKEAKKCTTGSLEFNELILQKPDAVFA